MASFSLLVPSLFLFFFHSLLHSSMSQESRSRSSQNCSSFTCGELGHIQFPFTNRTNPECGLFVVDNCNKPIQRIRFSKDEPRYNVTRISQDNTVVLSHQLFSKSLGKNICNGSFKNFIRLHNSSFVKFKMLSSNLTLLNCSPSETSENLKTSLNGLFCHDNLQSSPPGCSIVDLTKANKIERSDVGLVSFTDILSIEVQVIGKCYECHRRGGQCQTDSNKNFQCSKGHKVHHLKLGLGIAAGLSALVLSTFMVWHWRRRKSASSIYQSRGSACSKTSSKSDMEKGNIYFGVPIFSYKELEKATSNFSGEKEVGDGGFGTVYYGKLRDGREVAVKRLYEHNYKRVEQFMNEIEILTRLRHKNLVSLYGCTSRQSQCLLLVYEFVPNGTVADHLHGDKSNPETTLSWPIRMKVAIETAAALSYLHASDIIHRDVKTNNILLDNNFNVKVADFGLSRLFPTDVTHVSTAPQGSPGYVDPEYHQCFQLTDKSDVYSFGVVLIELISSMSAVDISRQKDEIVLANLAINRIKKREIDGLIDPKLGFRTDERVRRMIILVAELAFQCLQQNKDARPSMDEVVAELLEINKIGEECKLDINDNEEVKRLPPSPSPSPPPHGGDEVVLLKKNRRFPPSSPISVTEKWVSSSNPTPNISG